MEEMLVLSRKMGETIHLDNGVVIRVCRLKGSKVQIGIEAPSSVRITRGELPQWDDQSPHCVETAEI